jgi:hypothetical protein
VSHIRSLTTLDDLIEESRYYELDDLTESIMKLQIYLNQHPGFQEKV